jgi:hypothetical protein
MRAAVPTGTVLLVMTMASRRRCGAMASTTENSALKSADPSAAGGVPTAKNTSRAGLIAAGVSVVKCNRSASKLRTTSSSRPGS